MVIMGLSGIPPILYTLLAEGLGALISQNSKLNQQSSIGNFFELLGQVILTFNAQQQLIQQGPGESAIPVGSMLTYIPSVNPAPPAPPQAYPDAQSQPQIAQSSKTDDLQSQINNLQCQISLISQQMASIQESIEKLKKS